MIKVRCNYYRKYKPYDKGRCIAKPIHINQKNIRLCTFQKCICPVYKFNNIEKLLIKQKGFNIVKSYLFEDITIEY